VVDSPLLSLRISVHYPGKPDVLRNLTLDMEQGEILGLVGSSGSGKSTLSLAILRLIGLRGGAVTGQMYFQDRDLMGLSERELRGVRGRQIGLVQQSPMSALNPSLRIGTQLNEAWNAHAVPGAGKRSLLPLLESVSLPAEESFLRLYPRQLSVGLAQRVLIAMAVIHRPALLIADEPTSALDGITQAEILQLFARLNRELNMGILYISHDLLSVASICHRVAILHEGGIVELNTTERIFRNPDHPYTRRLIDALPANPWAVLRAGDLFPFVRS
jgi:ABC-type dipeptide/oligopeptide/nickel transport system ATPase component